MSAIIEATRELKRTISMSGLASRAGLQLQRAGDEWLARCPFHKDDSPSFSIYCSDSRWICFAGCGGGDAVDFAKRFYRVSHVGAVRMLGAETLPDIVRHHHPVECAPKVSKTPQALAIWRQAAPIAGTEGDTYFRSRGLDCRLPESLRFARLHHPSDPRGMLRPCVVALVASVENRAVGIHRIFLNDAGTGKAPVDNPKLSLGPIRGHAVRLAPAAAELIITEGVEDSLTLQQGLGAAAWATAGAGMLGRLELPAGVRSVIIGADNDDAGRAAASAAGKRFASEGRQVRIIYPEPGYKDFNAELMGQII